MRPRQSLGDTGPVALEEHVGLLDEREGRRETVGMLEVEGDGGAAAAQQVGLGRQRDGQRALTGPVDSDDVGAEVGEQHRREGRGADAGELDDADAGKGSRARGRCALGVRHALGVAERRGHDWSRPDRSRRMPRTPARPVPMKAPRAPM